MLPVLSTFTRTRTDVIVTDGSSKFRKFLHTVNGMIGRKNAIVFNHISYHNPAVASAFT